MGSKTDVKQFSKSEQQGLITNWLWGLAKADLFKKEEGRKKIKVLGLGD